MHRNLISFSAVGLLLLATVTATAAPPASSVSNLWRLSYEDNFDGSMLDGNAWTITDSCAGVICRHPENIEVSGGTLKINTLEANPFEDPPEVDYTTGRIDSVFTLAAGYVEVSSRAAEDSGIQSSVFTGAGGNVRPNVTQAYEGDSNDGLTDWNFINGVDGDYFEEFVFDSADPFPGSTDLSAALHTFSLHWTEANELIWKADGTETARTQVPIGIYGAPASIAVGSAIRNEDFGIPRNPLGTSMEVDYVRIYQKRDICLGCDSFIYSGGGLAGADGGRGWAEPWSVTSGSVDVDGMGESLSVSGIELPTPIGDRATGVAFDVAVRPLAAPGLALGSNQSYFVSMLVRKDGAGDFQISFRRSSDNAVRWFFGGDDAEAAYTGVQSVVSTANAFPAGETVLVVAKMAAVASGTDTVFLKIFRDGDVLPADESGITWTVSGTGNSGITLDFMDIDVFAGSVEIDEIKIGTSLADVISPSGSPSNAESFDYADANLDGKAGGTGWGGAWLALMTLSNDDVSLAYPDSPSTETLAGFGDKLVLSDGVAERAIADTFSLAEDNTYFMSFLANKGPECELLIEGLDAANNSRWRVGLRDINEVLGGVTSTVSSIEDDGSMAGSLDYPPSVPLNSNGSRIEHSGVGSAFRALSSSTPSQSPSMEDRWLSFLARKDSAGVFAVRVARTSDNIARWNVEVSADGTVRAEVDSGVDSAPGTFPDDESVLVISQFIGDVAGNDMVKVAVIAQGDPLPPDAGSIVWDAEVTRSTSVTMDRLIVDVIAGLVEIDEIRYGDTYESVSSTDTGVFDVDPINYTAGSIGGQGPWNGNLTVAGQPSDSLEYPSLTPPIAFMPDGGRVDHSGPGSALHPLSVTVIPDGGFTRWVSFLAAKDAAGSFAVRTRRTSDGIARWNLEFNADGSVRSEMFGGTTSAAGLFPNEETVLVIARFTGDTAGMDMSDILLLRSGDDLPANAAEIDTNGLWDVRHTESTSVYMEELMLEAISGRVQIDEIRYGSTYASVTSSGSNLFEQDSFAYPAGPIGGNGDWTGDLNIAGPEGGFVGGTVFVLSMFQAHAVGGTDTDMVYVKVFRSADEVPVAPTAIADWDVVAGGNTGVFLSRVRITGIGPDDIMLDELKIGTTYATVTDFSVPGDCDDDGDVDLGDYNDCFAPCLGGPGLALPEGCEDADLDGDHDVDLRDFAFFSALF